MNINLGKSIIVFTVFLVIASLLHFSPSANIALAQITNSGTGSSQQPGINAANLFNTQTMTLGNNVKNLVILIANEGHHGPGEEDEARFIETPFVPANAIVSAGTTVAWFNGDVGHEQTVNVKDATGASTVFTTGVLTDSQISPTYTFNTPGTYSYEALGDEGYIMKGTITVNNIQSPVSTPVGVSGTSGGIDTVGVLMVPTQALDTYVQAVRNAGLTVDSTQNFIDLRGGQSGTGEVQTLLVWTSGGKDLNSVIAPLSQLSLGLPYE